jgi:protein-tyrosine phosphatase
MKTTRAPSTSLPVSPAPAKQTASIGVQAAAAPAPGPIDFPSSAPVGADFARDLLRPAPLPDATKRRYAAQSAALGLGGVAKGLEALIPPEKMAVRMKVIDEALEAAIPSLDGYRAQTPASRQELVAALGQAADAAQPYLQQLGLAYQDAQAAGLEGLMRDLDQLAAKIQSLVVLADSMAIVPPDSPALAAVERAGGGVALPRPALKAALILAAVSEQTGLEPATLGGVLSAYVGRMSEIGFQDPAKFYAALEAQKEGVLPPNGLPIRPDFVSDRLDRGATLLYEAAGENPGADVGALKAAVLAKIQVRTSETHPIQVGWIDTPGVDGQLGLTLAPGKGQPSLYQYVWQRDLGADLDALRDVHGVDVIVPLIEDYELQALGIPNLVQEAEARGMIARRMPIQDQNVPDPEKTRALADELAAHLKAGRKVLVHCKGGLGRAGTIASSTLVRLGASAEDAITRVRAGRPGAVENEKQEQFIAAFAQKYGV